LAFGLGGITLLLFLSLWCGRVRCCSAALPVPPPLRYNRHLLPSVSTSYLSGLDGHFCCGGGRAGASHPSHFSRRSISPGIGAAGMDFARHVLCRHCASAVPDAGSRVSAFCDGGGQTGVLSASVEQWATAWRRVAAGVGEPNGDCFLPSSCRAAFKYFVGVADSAAGGFIALCLPALAVFHYQCLYIAAWAGDRRV